ncbi:MAG: hypothetical protein NT025_09250 [bacterium]|nr:hypothetical protein [bacterium]
MFAAAAAVFVLVHWRALYVAPSFDDWAVIAIWRDAVRHASGLNVLMSVFQGTTGDFWRPLTNFAFALVNGESAFLPQALKLLAIVGMAALMVAIARQLGFSRTASWLIGCALLVHQGMVLGQEIDRWGDVLCNGALLGIFSLSLRFSRIPFAMLTYAIAIGLLAFAAMFSKESGIVVLAIPLAVGFVRSTDAEGRRGQFIAAGVALLVAALYLALRFQHGLTFGSRDPYYALTFGTNVVSNILMMAFALVQPINVVDIVMVKDIRVLAVAFAATLGFLTLAGLWRSRRRAWRVILLAALLFVVVQGPTLLMARTTEVNFSRSLPFGLLLVAIPLVDTWGSASRRGRYALSILLLAIASLHVAATYAKVSGVVRVSRQARDFRDQVQRLMPSPPDRKLVFVAERTYHGYSSSARPLWMCIPGDATIGMRERYHKPSYRAEVYIIDHSPCLPDSLRDFDFLLDRANRLHDRFGHSVLIEPPDPYLKPQ